MTMVALISHPTKSTSPLPTMITPTHCQVPKEPTASYLITQHSETNVFYSTAVLHDIPMDICMTAAALNADDDDNNDDHG